MLNNQRLRHDGGGGDFPIENCKGVPVFLGSKFSLGQRFPATLG